MHNHQPHAPSEPSAAGSRDDSTARSSHGRKFNLNRAQVVDETFVEFVRLLAAHAEDATSARANVRSLGAANNDAVIDPDSSLTGRDLIELFESQIVARHQDLESRLARP